MAIEDLRYDTPDNDRQYRRHVECQCFRRMIVNDFVDAIQLGTNVARIRKVIGDMIELVIRHRQLQPR